MALGGGFTASILPGARKHGEIFDLASRRAARGSPVDTEGRRPRSAVGSLQDEKPGAFWLFAVSVPTVTHPTSVTDTSN